MRTPRRVISKEEASDSNVAVAEPPENEKLPEAPTVKFRTSNVGLVYLKDGSSFPFNKPLLSITNPDLIEKLTEVANRPQTSIFIVE